MMRTVCLIGLVCALSVFGQLPLADLPVGSTLGTIPPTTLELSYYPQIFYRLWVPENVSSLTVEFSQTDAVCTGDIRYNIHADHIPCGSKWSADSDTNYPCREAISDYFTDSSSDTVDLFPGSYSNSALLNPGQFVYISLSRDVPSSDYEELCTYTLDVTRTECGAGQFGINEGSSSSATCVAHSDLTVGTMTLPGTDTSAYWRLVVPSQTANIQVTIVNVTSGSYIYGNPLYAGVDYYYECYDYASYNSATENYDIELICYNPPAGNFFLYLENGDPLEGVMTTSISTCAEDRTGYNCTYIAYNITEQDLSGQSFGIDADEGASSSFPDAFKVFYLSAPAGSMGFSNISVTLTVGTSAYMYYRRNGFIADNSDNYLFYESLTLNSGETVALTPLDLYLGGNFLVGVSNEGTAAINFTLTSSSAGPVVTTTDAATTEATSTTGSSAVAIVASFQLVVAVAMSLLFA